MSSRRWSMLVTVGAALVSLALVATPAGAASRRTPTQAPANTVVDGPSAAIVGLSGMAIARDGTGALVYLRSDTGIAHVFVSLLRNGVFGPPQQVDSGLAAASSQPVVAVTNNGLTQIAFINAGTLYTVSAANTLAPLGAPVALATGASDPSLSLSTYGKGYLAFTEIDLTSDPTHPSRNVRYAALISGGWTLSSAVLDQNPADDAGGGTARPRVVCAGDGTGIATWGENGHIFTRRVRGTTPSTTILQADPSSLAGAPEVSADLPVVGAGGDSSYATVAFRETLGSGSARQSRVLVNRLHASRFDGVSGADGLTTPGGEGAGSPAVAVTEYGDGLITAAGDTSHNLFATALGSNDQPGGSSQINSLSQSSAPGAVPATVGTVSTLVAWQQDSGGGTPAEIRIRYAPDGVDLDPEQAVSTPDLGPTNAALGLAAGGDLSGDAAIAWVQGSGAGTRIVTAQLFQGPRGFSPNAISGFATTAQPQFSWTPAGEQWGPLNYVVKIDGVPIGGTQGTSLVPTAALPQGRHTWQASATNLAGLTVLARPATVFVDSMAPKISVRITGSHRLGATLTAKVTASDAPPLLPASYGSGVQTLTLSWGDRTGNVSLGRVSRTPHVYRRTGRYRLTITAVDRAGNRAVATRTVTVKPINTNASGRRHVPIIRPGRRGR